jgi:hypothetical protein
MMMIRGCSRVEAVTKKKVESSLYFSSVRVVCVSRREDEDQREDGCAPVKMSYLHEAMRLVGMWHAKMRQRGLVIRMICWLQSTSRKFGLGGDC